MFFMMLLGLLISILGTIIVMIFGALIKNSLHSLLLIIVGIVNCLSYSGYFYLAYKVTYYAHLSLAGLSPMSILLIPGLLCLIEGMIIYLLIMRKGRATKIHLGSNIS
jgi:hypothetical protein